MLTTDSRVTTSSPACSMSVYEWITYWKEGEGHVLFEPHRVPQHWPHGASRTASFQLPGAE